MKRYLYGIIVGLIAVSVQAQQTTRISKALGVYNDVIRQLDMSYVDTLNYEELVETSIRAMLNKIDPYTVYIPESQTTNLRMMTTGKYGGIGAIIMQRDKRIFIQEPYEGMPAQKNGLLAGDEILEIDGQKATNSNVSAASSLLRGKAGTKVRLKIRRGEELKPFIVEFEREEIKLKPVPYYTVLPITTNSKPTGYIRFDDFTEKSSDIFRQAVQDMVSTQQIERLIIDLRSNGGGIIDEAVKIVGLFVSKGTEIVSVRGKNTTSNRVYKTLSEPLFPDMKIAILVDDQTASAAEIVAGSMQDLDRATIIGERTYGKGLVQNVRSVTRNGHLKVTTGRYYIPSGRCIQAIDYSKRRADGSAERMPDSLTHEFKTKKGRIVRDGGGIEPDIHMTDTADKYSITYPLYTEHYFFDYASAYFQAHPTIPAAETFQVTDEILDDFCQFLEQKGFQYEPITLKYLKDLIGIAQKDDIDSSYIQQLTALQTQIAPPVRASIMKDKERVKQYLGEAIVERYYYQRGKMGYLIRDDKQVLRAEQELR